MPTSTNGAHHGSEFLRAAYIERHGTALGQFLYESEMKRRAEQVVPLEKLKTQRDAAVSARDAKEQELAKRLVPLRATMDTAYQGWLRACEALEAQRIRNEGELAPLQQRVYEIDGEMRGPLLFEGMAGRQWQTPDWAQSDMGPMPHT
jgi:hypothetical protein